MLGHPEGFVAQHHTRASPYLALRLKAYGIRPIVTTCSIFDCIVSFDDMTMQRAADLTHPWVVDPPFLLPHDYCQLDAARRHELLAASFAPWLVNFALSWRRCETAGLVAPLRLNFRTDITDPDRLAARLTGGLSLNEAEAARLRAYVRNPDLERARFNQGVVGRGRQQLASALQARVEDYARGFQDEFPDAELSELLA